MRELPVFSLIEAVSQIQAGSPIRPGFTVCTNRRWVSATFHYSSRPQTRSKTSIGPARLCVRDNRNRRNKLHLGKLPCLHYAVESKYPIRTSSYFWDTCNTLRRSACTTMARLTNGLNIRRPKKKMNLINETCIKACVSRFDSGSYNTRMQFRRAVSHSVGAPSRYV